jgi:radical SAM protein with 4Fe4S-binding SPASM domain
MASTVTVLVSLHGPYALSHEVFSGVRGSFDEPVTNIKRAAEAGLRVSTSTVLTRWNWNRVEEMAAFARSLGADHAVFNRYIGQPLPVLEATPSQVAQSVQCVETLIAKGEPVRWGTPVPLCASPRATSGCLAGEAFATVDPWGKVRPCNHAPYIVGNLLEQSFEEVWHSSKMEAWRAMVPPECADCAEYERCTGGCRAEAMLRPASSYPLPRKPFRIEMPVETEMSHVRVAA